MSDRKFSGAAITHDDDLPAMLELLAHRIRHKMKYVRYDTPSAITANTILDFVIVGDLETLESTVRHYKRLGTLPPLIIHLIYDGRIIDYEQHFPGVDVEPIHQAALDQQDTTLKFDLFETILQALASRR